MKITAQMSADHRCAMKYTIWAASNLKEQSLRIEFANAIAESRETR